MIDSTSKPQTGTRKPSDYAGKLLSLTLQDDLQAFEGILNNLMSHAREQFGMDVSFISQFSEDKFFIRYANGKDGYQPLTIDGCTPLEETYCSRVVEGSLPEYINDSKDYREAYDLAVTEKLHIGSYLSVPLVLSDRTVYGTFCCYSRQADQQLSQRDIESMRFLADCVALILERGLGNIKGLTQQQQEIQSVVQQRQFYSVFQPIFCLQTGRVQGFEALSRFTGQPQRPPDIWFQQALTVDLQAELELATLQGAVDSLQPLPDSTYVTFNLSANTIVKHQPELLAALAGLANPVIEITEHDVIDDYQAVNTALAPLRAMGVRVAVDDVGAGFASLKHILSLQPDIIKIDRSMVRNIDQRSEAQAVARAIVSFAQELSYQVVAEGIETEAELATLKQLAVVRGQGFLLGRPEQDALSRWSD